MTYYFNFNVPDDSEEGQAVADLAARENVSLDEAARKLFLQGARTVQPKSPLDGHEAPLEMLARLKAEKARRLNGIATRTGSGDIVGLLADDPEGVELIREAAAERRHALYGD